MKIQIPFRQITPFRNFRFTLRLVIILFAGILFILLFVFMIGRVGLRQNFQRGLQSKVNSEPKTITEPKEDNFPVGTAYWSHYDLPELTMAERLAKTRQAKTDKEKYYRENMAIAQELSNKLEDYIYSWLKGKADPKLPKGFLPPYIDSQKTKDWTLQKEGEINPDQQWYMIPSHQVDPEYKKLYMLGVDHHVTYWKLIFLAPFGSKLLIEGDFPHARFMDYQILQPFDPARPASGAMGEQPEVPIVDADIEPDPNNVNPFRVGANRNAVNRHYHLTFDLKAGNAVELNPEVMKPPMYRASGNSRVGGPMGFAGPWADNVLVPSVLIVRIYAPDKNLGPMAGVKFPKAILQLPSGEKFWLKADFSLAKERQTTRVPAGSDSPQEPIKCLGSSFGWLKIYGLILVRQEFMGYLSSSPCGNQDSNQIKARTRQANALLFNRGLNETPPGNFQASATTNNYATYLTRVLMKGANKVYVLTGKLPNTPKTRNGEPTMQTGEARYFSISRGGKGEGEQYETSVHYGSLMDDEIITDKNNNYIVVYSSKEDRPKNATAQNGVTWQDMGPRNRQSITIRWVSVPPEWYLPKYAPDESNIPWEMGAWSENTYNKSLVGENKPGALGPYHPVIHYLSKQEFEALGDKVTVDKIPLW